eukprot:132834-Amorphochlora_amoeboformis.AAC.1
MGTASLPLAPRDSQGNLQNSPEISERPEVSLECLSGMNITKFSNPLAFFMFFLFELHKGFLRELRATGDLIGSVRDRY